MGTKNTQYYRNVHIIVSIQLVSPASGDQTIEAAVRLITQLVSIQLVSPASGDSSGDCWTICATSGFHSISFPSEWGLPSLLWPFILASMLVSIQLVSPASGDATISITASRRNIVCFHSISFPSEWGQSLLTYWLDEVYSCFHSISFPSEWGQWKKILMP